MDSDILDHWLYKRRVQEHKERMVRRGRPVGEVPISPLIDADVIEQITMIETELGLKSQVQMKTRLSLKDRLRIRWKGSSLRRAWRRCVDICRRSFNRCYGAMMFLIYSVFFGWI